MGNSESEAETGSIIPKKKVKRTGSFEGAWTQIYTFNKPAKNENEAHCIYCKKDFSIIHGVKMILKTTKITMNTRKKKKVQKITPSVIKFI